MVEIQMIIDELKAAIKDRKIKALQTQNNRKSGGEKEAYYIVHEVDGLEDARQ